MLLMGRLREVQNQPLRAEYCWNEAYRSFVQIEDIRCIGMTALFLGKHYATSNPALAVDWFSLAREAAHKDGTVESKVLDPSVDKIAEDEIKSIGPINLSMTR